MDRFVIWSGLRYVSHKGDLPTTFLWVMNDVFRLFMDEFLIVYIDDILIFSKSWEDHENHVRKELDVLENEILWLKISKHEFGETSLVYLGYRVGGGELKIDPFKVKFITK